MPRHVFIRGLTCCLFLACAAGCRHPGPIPSPPSVAPEDFADLKPGGSLRILLPLYAGEPVVTETGGLAGSGNPGITLSAPNLLGYRIVRYNLQQAANGRVRLRFARSETTLDSKTIPDRHPPSLPFALPEGSQYIRLLYLVRVSKSDHNMAVLAARQLPSLDEITARVKADPEACLSGHGTFCSWVPARVSLRPESTAASVLR